MRTFKKVIQVMIVIAVSQLLVSCLVIKCGKLPDIEVLPDLSEVQDKPSALIQVQYNVLRKKRTVALESITLREKFKPYVEKVTSESNLFSYCVFASFTREDFDYVIQIDMSQYTSPGAKASAYICGFSLGAIPGFGKDHFILSCKVIDKDQNEILFQYEDCTKLYGHLFLLPFSFTAINSTEKMWENMINVFYDDLIRNEVLN